MKVKFDFQLVIKDYLLPNVKGKVTIFIEFSLDYIVYFWIVTFLIITVSNYFFIKLLKV